jgi:hypothetical protein
VKIGYCSSPEFVSYEMVKAHTEIKKAVDLYKKHTLVFRVYLGIRQKLNTKDTKYTRRAQRKGIFY